MADVAIGFVHGDMVHARFMKSVIDEMCRDGAIIIEEQSEPFVDKARNHVVERFLKSGREWLLNVDTDVILPACVISRLLARNQPLVSALLMVNEDKPFPMIYHRIADVGAEPYGVFLVQHEYEAGKLYEADATGAGCVLIHKEVFEAIPGRMPYRWFQHEAIGTEIFGEDFTFYKRARAVGYPLFIDTAIHAGHIKNRVI